MLALGRVRELKPESWMFQTSASQELMTNRFSVRGDVVAIHLGGRIAAEREALIDIGDFDLINSLAGRWVAQPQPHSTYETVYARFQPAGGGPQVYMHRLILGFPPAIVDHIDHDALNNRRSNLRTASKTLNGLNRRAAQPRNKLGVRGVARDGNQYRARITVRGVVHEVGRFDDISVASAAVEDFVRSAITTVGGQ